MIGAIGNGLGNAWGQIKKVTDTTVQAVAAAAGQNSTPTPAPTATPGATEPTAPATSPVIISAPVASEPLTYTASTGPRQVTASSASETPVRTTLSERLAETSYYASPAASAVADPIASAQREKDGAALTQAQVIAQAAYSIVARAGVDDRMTLIRDS
jgi:hypothetical protein